MQKIRIEEAESGKRIDKALVALFPDYSRSSIEKLIESGDILVNGQNVKTKYILKPNDIVNVDFSELDREPDTIELPILFEDDNVVVINKPVGVLAHTKGVFSKEGTVATFVQPKLSGDESWRHSNRAGIVHRLDRGTSGVMIIAKNKAAEDFLKGQFSKRNVKKTYVAVISGKLPESSGLIDVPIERNPKKPATFRAGINGKPAQTHFSVLRESDKRTTTNDSPVHSLIELKPITGRTHQLRVHLKYLKHPIVGDEFYDGEKASRLMLHAKSLEITLPGGERTLFETDIPKELTDYFL